MLKTESTRQCFQEAMKMLTCGMREEQTQENTKKEHVWWYANRCRKGKSYLVSNKAPTHHHCKDTRKDSRPESASRQGQEKALHITIGMARLPKVQHHLPRTTEAHWLVPKRRKRKITTHQPPVPSEGSGGNILKESLKLKNPKHTGKSSPYSPFQKYLRLWLDL